jgi:Ca2+-binding RTX toxin-like protein
MTLNATGSKALTVSALNADVTTVDASGMDEGGSFVQSARSATAASTYTGSAGNDTFIMVNTADAITGGAGTGDTLDVNFTAVLGAIAVDLSATGDQVTTMNGLANTVVQSGFENVDLAGYSGKGASVTGSSAANTITGTALADTFSAGGGIDTITGGIGNDTYSVGASDAANDIVVIAFATDGVDIIQDFNFGASGDTLQLTLGVTVNDTSTNAGAINTGVDGGSVAVAALAANTAVGATSTVELLVCAEDLTTVTINSTKTAIEAEAATQLSDTTDVQANSIAGEGALFMMDNGTDSFLFLVEESATNVGTTDAAEVALLAIFTGLDAENVHTDNFV